MQPFPKRYFCDLFIFFSIVIGFELRSGVSQFPYSINLAKIHFRNLDLIEIYLRRRARNFRRLSLLAIAANLGESNTTHIDSCQMASSLHRISAWTGCSIYGRSPNLPSSNDGDSFSILFLAAIIRFDAICRFIINRNYPLEFFPAQPTGQRRCQ